jgi:hypothetical protein
MKVLGWLGLAFSGFGLVFGGVGAFTYLQASAFVEAAQHAQGSVVENVERRSSSGNRGSTYAPRVRFTPAGGATPIEFTSSSSSSPPEYAVGETVPVLYDPQQPFDARLDGTFSNYGVSLIFGLFGAIFGSIGIGFVITWIVKRKRRAEVLARGTPVSARFIGVERNTSIKVNGRSPWRIVCQWQNPSTGNIHVFKSDDIWFDPSAHVSGDLLRVLILPDKPHCYMVDVSFLPQLAD